MAVAREEVEPSPSRSCDRVGNRLVSPFGKLTLVEILTIAPSLTSSREVRKLCHFMVLLITSTSSLEILLNLEHLIC